MLGELGSLIPVLLFNFAYPWLQLTKKKIWEAVQPLLKTDSEGVANFKGRPMRGEGGVVRSKTLFNGNIS